LHEAGRDVREIMMRRIQHSDDEPNWVV
jgi:hypothetical protein